MMLYSIRERDQIDKIFDSISPLNSKFSHYSKYCDDYFSENSLEKLKKLHGKRFKISVNYELSQSKNNEKSLFNKRLKIKDSSSNNNDSSEISIRKINPLLFKKPAKDKILISISKFKNKSSNKSEAKNAKKSLRKLMINNKKNERSYEERSNKENKSQVPCLNCSKIKQNDSVFNNFVGKVSDKVQSEKEDGQNKERFNAIKQPISPTYNSQILNYFNKNNKYRTNRNSKYFENSLLSLISNFNNKNTENSSFFSDFIHCSNNKLGKDHNRKLMQNERLEEISDKSKINFRRKTIKIRKCIIRKFMNVNK